MDILGRFKDHISEAKCNTKKNQCWYLNNAIRHYNANSYLGRITINL